MTLADLKLLPQWVGYTAAKVPMNPHNGRAAASNNPDTWGTAAQAWAAKKRHNWAGVGYVFTIAAGVVGVDLDDCFDADGRLSDEARQIVQMLNSYTERSPSGTGLHILARGSIPHSIKTDALWRALSLNVAARSRHPGGVNSLFADGHVQFMTNSINLPTWQALGSRDLSDIAQF